MQALPGGDLECLELVGCGGFGLVYRGWSRTLGTEIALKMIEGEKGDGLKDFMKERDLMHKANYTYVLRLLGVYEKRDGDQIEYGLVMEYMHNGSLRRLFDNVPDVPWALRFQILHQVVLGMNYLHHVLKPPIIHRDLKPRNVLLNKSLDVQITDFGLAKTAGSATTSLNQSMTGTVAYMPPESFKTVNYKPTKEFDVYSFAILTWSVLSGQEPYSVAGSDMIKLLIPNGSRPDMDLVNKWTSVKMVAEAIDLMIKCWDEFPENRPSFSDCKPLTLTMTRAYARDIDKAVHEVLVFLKRHSTARRGSKPEDLPDGATVSPMTNLQYMSSHFNIQVFKECLDQQERSKAEVEPFDDQIDSKGHIKPAGFTLRATEVHSDMTARTPRMHLPPSVARNAMPALK
ncbi:receptor-interacting serine/threonine-protein kinase 3-like isoform X2 [Spea bombifrons]|uniref:receptor-interacting serine/threonine-protein kinase 3-like isoform X2 n=1 Tax=Spea bombifrons TaxID=233779 RepID=UPI00234BB3CD|nr:receptor-interacting serine/threonine-protein kinase 3-like isoform X2 [Spea bombifrons]